jgi:hypothetical protein
MIVSFDAGHGTWSTNGSFSRSWTIIGLKIDLRLRPMTASPCGLRSDPLSFKNTPAVHWEATMRFTSYGIILPNRSSWGFALWTERHWPFSIRKAGWSSKKTVLSHGTDELSVVGNEDYNAHSFDMLRKQANQLAFTMDHTSALMSVGMDCSKN